MNINEHGVCIDCETIAIPMPPRCSMEINLAEIDGGWRFGYTALSPLNCGGGVGYPCSVNFPNAVENRDAAICAAIDAIRRYLQSPSDKYNVAMIAKLDAWIESQRQTVIL